MYIVCCVSVDIRYHWVQPNWFDKYVLVIASIYRKPSDVPERVR